MRYSGSYDGDYIDKDRDYRALRGDPDLRSSIFDSLQAVSIDEFCEAIGRRTDPQRNLAHLVVGAGYVGFIGLVIGLITGNLALAVSGSVAAALLLALILKKISKNKNKSPEKLIDEHVDWLMSLFQKFRLFIKNRDYAKISSLSHGMKRAWDVQLVVSFVRDLAVVFPEEWDEWGHEISDIMESRTRMQSKGMNHRLVSLITFYRLFRFALHIGIDKVFILATRRATR